MASTTAAQTRQARAAKQAERRAAKAEAALQPCGCGCGATTARRYAPGHDAKHKSALLAKWDAGQDLTEAEAATMAGLGYDAARLADRREADATENAAAQAKADAANAKRAAKAKAKAEAAADRAAKAAAKAQAAAEEAAKLG